MDLLVNVPVVEIYNISKLCNKFFKSRSYLTSVKLYEQDIEMETIVLMILKKKKLGKIVECKKFA